MRIRSRHTYIVHNVVEEEEEEEFYFRTVAAQRLEIEAWDEFLQDRTQTFGEIRQAHKNV